MSNHTAALTAINSVTDRGSYDTVTIFDADGEEVADFLVESSEDRAAYDAALAAEGYSGAEWMDRPNSMLVQVWHEEAVNGSEAGSWQTVEATEHYGATIPDGWEADVEGPHRLVLTDAAGAVLAEREQA